MKSYLNSKPLTRGEKVIVVVAILLLLCLAFAPVVIDKVTLWQERQERQELAQELRKDITRLVYRMDTSVGPLENRKRIDFLDQKVAQLEELGYLVANFGGRRCSGYFLQKAPLNPFDWEEFDTRCRDRWGPHPFQIREHYIRATMTSKEAEVDDILDDMRSALRHIRDPEYGEYSRQDLNEGIERLEQLGYTVRHSGRRLVFKKGDIIERMPDGRQYNWFFERKVAEFNDEFPLPEEKTRTPSGVPPGTGSLIMLIAGICYIFSGTISKAITILTNKPGAAAVLFKK